MRFPIFLLALAAAVIGFGPVAMAEPRVALVIGNSTYGAEIGNLANPANDAKLMATTLRGIGFEVIEIENADQQAMKRAIVDFGNKLSDAGSTATGLFYYAGHGLQVRGENYLIPIKAKIEREADVDVEAVPATLLLKQMDFAGSAVNIVILDACRNNPLSRGFRSQDRGLAEINVKPRGSFIAYSTAPGDVAADGNSKNSPYTIALSQTIAEPGIGIEEVFREVRGKVIAATGQKQTPWDSSSLTAPFYFVPAAVQTAPEPQADPVELAFWDTIKGSKSADDFQAYLAKYPDGNFAALAKIRVKELSGSAPAAANSAPAKDDAPAPVAAAPAPTPATVATTVVPDSPAPTSVSLAPEIVAASARLYARDKARLRGEPSRDGTVLERLAAGTVLTATGRSADGQWWRVTLPDGRTGYVGESVVTDQPPQQPAPSAESSTATAAAPTGNDTDTCKSDSAASTERTEACRRLLAAGIADTTDHYNALIFLGNALTDLGKNDDAIRNYRAAIEIDPKFFSAYYGIGLVNLNVGRYAEARAAFEKSAALNPDDAASVFQRGVAVANLGDFNSALADVQRAIAMKPDDSSYYDELSVLHLANGEVESAVADIDRGVSLYADFWSGTGILAYYLGGKLDKSIGMAETAIKTQADYPYFWIWKALAQKAGGDASSAEVTLASGREAFGKDEWPAPLIDYLGGKISESKLRALAKSSDPKVQSERLCEINFYVGELAFQSGDKAAARSAMQNATESRIYYYLEYAAARARLVQLSQQ